MEELVCGSPFHPPFYVEVFPQSFPSVEISSRTNENEKLNLSNGLSLCPVGLAEQGFDFSLWWDVRVRKHYPLFSNQTTQLIFMYLLSPTFFSDSVTELWIRPAGLSQKKLDLACLQRQIHHFVLWSKPSITFGFYYHSVHKVICQNMLKYSHSCIYHTSVHCVFVNNDVFGCRTCVLS